MGGCQSQVVPAAGGQPKPKWREWNDDVFDVAVVAHDGPPGCFCVGYGYGVKYTSPMTLRLPSPPPFPPATGAEVDDAEQGVRRVQLILDSFARVRDVDPTSVHDVAAGLTAAFSIRVHRARFAGRNINAVLEAALDAIDVLRSGDGDGDGNCSIADSAMEDGCET